MTAAYKFDNIIRRTIVATIFLLLSFGVAAQVTITGYVYDENRTPIIGASVIEKNGSATMTDVKGWFKIESSERKPLTVTFIGCKLLEINEKEDKYVEVTLMPDKSKRESSYIAIKTMTYYKALEGDAQSQFEMAKMYEDDLNYTEAAEWYKKAANGGHASAQNNLGYCYYAGDGVTKDYTEAVKWFRKAAKLGDSTAQYNLARCYFDGDGVKQDYTEAVKWYRKAAEKGNAEAQNQLGNCYYAGDGIKQDYTEAVKWYQLAAEKGNAWAQYNLGNCYYYGRGVTKDYTEAVKWFRKAAEKGGAEAQNQLGNCYYAGDGIKQDYTEAVKWYRKAAEEGDAWAQYNLGNCYYAGDGIKQDYTEAVKWFRKAAEKGNAMAQSNLGCCYYVGDGVTKDYNEAVKWYRKAAEQGNEWGQFYLGGCYFDGYGVTKDYTEAVKWYRKAAEQGHASAQNNLGYCFYNGHGVITDYTEAIKWYRKAAEQGILAGQFHLGECYYYGRGVTQDYTEAVKWFHKVAEQGFAKAQNNLGECYYYGRGITQDYTEAVKWYRKAAEQGNKRGQYNLGYCYNFGQGVDTNHKEAVKWYQLAAEQGDIDAQSSLGECYYYGRGIAQDYTEAVKWYHKAAEQGDADAQSALGFCYAMSEGVPYDMNQAEMWWRKAAEKGNIDAIMALQNLEEERTKGINPPQELATLLTGVSHDFSDEDMQKIKDALDKKKANNPASELIEPATRKYTHINAGTKSSTSVSPQFRVLSDSKVIFNDSRQVVRFAVSDPSHSIKYRIDGGETVTLTQQTVESGVCEIDLPQQDCLLTMWCVGGDPHTIQYIYDSESSARKSATLHILAIGLNKYQDPALDDLNYAEKDARDVVSTIQKKHKHTFANIDAQLLVGSDVTSEMISEKINNLADKASASDMAVIFFAGHGLVDERDRYYLSTYNITDAKTPRRGGYSASQFVEDISYIDCKLLVFIDACYSGKLLEGYRGSVSSENFFREMNNTPNGTCIYTSSNKDVKSKESTKYKHGVFTQALIESFEFENSDTDSDNRISVIEVRNYLEKRIPQLTQNKQKPIYRNVEEIDFTLFIK